MSSKYLATSSAIVLSIYFGCKRLDRSSCWTFIDWVVCISTILARSRQSLIFPQKVDHLVDPLVNSSTSVPWCCSTAAAPFALISSSSTLLIDPPPRAGLPALLVDVALHVLSWRSDTSAYFIYETNSGSLSSSFWGNSTSIISSRETAMECPPNTRHFVWRCRDCYVDEPPKGHGKTLLWSLAIAVAGYG